MLEIWLQLLMMMILKDSLAFCEGTHTLCYDLTAMSQKLSGQPQSWVLGYLDGYLFLRYNKDSRKAEAWGLSMKGPMGADTWARETEELQEKEQQLKTMLAEVMQHHRHHRGLHSLQATMGCELQGNLITGGSWRLGYNGQDFLTYNLETNRWKVAKPLAHTAEILRKMHVGPRAEHVKAFFYDSCPAQLRRHLAALRNQLQDTGRPKVMMTHWTSPWDRTILRCSAFNLYSPITTLTWLRDGEPVQQPTAGPGALLPSGDGTYQTWVSIVIFSGEELQYSCYLQHGSQNITVSAFSVPPGHQNRNTAATLAVPVVLSAALVLLTWA